MGSKITRWATSIKKKRLIANFMSQGTQKKNRLYPVHKTPIFVGLEEVSVLSQLFFEEADSQNRTLTYFLPSH